ncbi:Gfo/Idh/MocA family oxidoreductase [Streptomyces sp. NBC_00237]|uniref:Gfo/Idh/MocA family oxidoreductase n=1 Tax=Streptomyces sp. NBC_00237 TaxID=2975687 RepID=UPI00224DDBCA|nr:Gfo/Idh/MocA family oxidoreductase [Streptomyces sp. NBC_00237]MCX5207358.1 Gfo/Idh/MocA family oxidoreductase [Streptomyces sp. NBC_00237]
MNTVKVLIAGMGYAGTRFLTALRTLSGPGEPGPGPTGPGPSGPSSGPLDLNIEVAYHARHRTIEDIPYFASLTEALDTFSPDLVIVAVTDSAHAEILTRLKGYRGFVLAEKPLTSLHDDLEAVTSALTEVSGFAMDLVGRYSEASVALHRYVHHNRLALVRAHATWGKNRINDHRPTVGVTSEVIHSLDLVQRLSLDGSRLQLRHAVGVSSDYSISGRDVLDSVALTAQLGDAVVSAYSSFVNVTRQRTIDCVFRDPDGGLVYAAAEYSNPTWDADQLRIWRTADGREETLLTVDTRHDPVPEGFDTIVGLRRITADAVRYAYDRQRPAVEFADLAESVRLQRLLNEIELEARLTGPAAYFPDGRQITPETNLERLG